MYGGQKLDGYLTDKLITKRSFEETFFFFMLVNLKFALMHGRPSAASMPTPVEPSTLPPVCVRLQSVWQACFSELVPAALLHRFCRFFRGGFT